MIQPAQQARVCCTNPLLMLTRCNFWSILAQRTVFMLVFFCLFVSMTDDVNQNLYGHTICRLMLCFTLPNGGFKFQFNFVTFCCSVVFFSGDPFSPIFFTHTHFSRSAFHFHLTKRSKTKVAKNSQQNFQILSEFRFSTFRVKSVWQFLSKQKQKSWGERL